jgi:hypothetical protein
MKLPSISLFVALALVACAGSSRDVVEVYGGEGQVSVLERPLAVRAWRLDPDHDGAQPYEPTPAGYPAIEGPLELPAGLGARLGRALAAPASYVRSAPKGCLPRYGLRLEFAGDQTTVDVVFCFECSLLLAYRDGAYAGTGDFDPARRELARAALEAFPEEEGLRRWAESP